MTDLGKTTQRFERVRDDPPNRDQGTAEASTATSSCLRWAHPWGLRTHPTPPLSAEGLALPASLPRRLAPPLPQGLCTGPSLQALPLRSASRPLPVVPAPHLLPASVLGPRGSLAEFTLSLLHLLLRSRVWFTDLAAPRFASYLSLPGQPEPRRSPTMLTPSS